MKLVDYIGKTVRLNPRDAGSLKGVLVEISDSGFLFKIESGNNDLPVGKMYFIAKGTPFEFSADPMKTNSKTVSNDIKKALDTVMGSLLEINKIENKKTVDNSIIELSKITTNIESGRVPIVNTRTEETLGKIIKLTLNVEGRLKCYQKDPANFDKIFIDTDIEEINSLLILLSSYIFTL